MAHPLLRLVATQPELLAEHAQGYAALAGEEMAAFWVQWRRRVWLAALATVSAAVAATLGGVALMLWATAPIPVTGWAVWVPWQLWGVPACPLALALWCVWALQTPVTAHPWQALRAQVALDAAAWKTPPAP